MTKKLYILIFLVITVTPRSSFSQDTTRNESLAEADQTRPKQENPEANYLEMAVNYINDKNFAAARRYLQQAQNSGDEKIYQDSLVWSMYLDSLEGKRNMDSTLSTLPDANAARAMYYISDGWQTYFEKNPEIKDIYQMSLEYKEKLIARYPDSEYAMLVTQQLVPLFINEKNYDKALFYLLKYLDQDSKDMMKGNDDKAWFYLGQILENSREYRDLHKAIMAYQVVLKNPSSIFYVQAKNRILNLEKFYHIIQ